MKDHLETPTVPIFDGHNDTILRLEMLAARGRAVDFEARGEGGHLDLARARDGGFGGGFFAMFAPSGVARRRPNAALPHGPALSFTLRLFARLHRLARLHEDVVVAGSADQARRAMEAGRLAVVASLEGAEAIGADLDELEVLAAAGLRSLGLVWSRPNLFADGASSSLQPEPAPGGPLTAHGVELVRRCEEIGVMVDVSHLSERGFWDLTRVAEKPFVATHSNAHAICPSGRNLTDAQLDAIAERGGVVGLNFMVPLLRPDGRDAPEETGSDIMLRHLDHLVGKLGEDGVALGSDFDGCRIPTEIGDAAGLPRLIAAMRRAGWGETLIAKIARENWFAVMDRNGLRPVAT